MANLQSLIEFYKKVQIGHYEYSHGTIRHVTTNDPKRIKTFTIDYVNNLNAYDKNWNGGKTYSQLQNIIKSKSPTPMADAMNYFDSATSSSKRKLKNYRTAYQRFCEVILGRYNANVWLNTMLDNGRRKTSVFEMIAESAIFASPEIVNQLKARNKHACWFDNPYYIRMQISNGQKTTDCKGRPCVGNTNTKAQFALKSAVYDSCADVAISKNFVKYMTCHIVPDSTDDIDYFTSIPNLCLIPDALAGLSDHYQDVIDILNYHAITLYKLPYTKPKLDTRLMNVYKGLKWRVNY